MKYLKHFEKSYTFDDEDWDWDEDQPDKEYHGIIVDETGVLEHYKFIMLKDEEIKPGDWVVRVGDKYSDGTFGPYIQKVFGDYYESVSLCLDGYDDVESDYKELKKDLCKVKLK